MFNFLLRKVTLSFFVCCSASSLMAANELSEKRSFTINYSNISLLEYVRFVSKITNSNFVFNEQDLNFPVTILSEEPVTPDNVMATLLQILRMNNLTILEDGDNLIIQRGSAIKQIGSVISEKEKLDSSIPISTKIFRIKNANIASLTSILRPLISTNAIIETSVDTRQIIITDITQNIKKISDLIQNLDSASSPLNIESYSVKYGVASNLIDPLKQIINPLSNENPYILVPQDPTNTIYIVSTPLLIEKSLSLLGKLDVKATHTAQKAFKPENIFIYKPLYLSPDKLDDSLNELKETLLHQGHSEQGLVEALSNVEYIKETGSFLFSADEEVIKKLKEILATIDSPSKEHGDIASNTFFTYEPQFKTAAEVKKGIEEIAKTLASEKTYANQQILNTLNSAKLVESSKSLIFTGNPATFKQIQDLLKTVDTYGSSGEKSTFYIYTIKSASPDLLEQAIKDMAKYLDSTKIGDKALIESIETMKYIKETHSLVFSGPPSSLKRIQEVIENFDKTSLGELAGRQTFIIYKIKNASYNGISSSLGEMEKYLDSAKVEDKQLIESIKTMKYIEDTNSLAFSGSKETLGRLQTLLTSLDLQDAIKEPTQYLIYTPVNIPGNLLKEQIISTEKHLRESKLANPMFLKTLETVRWDTDSKSLFFTGDEGSLNQVKELLVKIDDPKSPEAINRDQSYFLYSLQDVSEESMEDYLKELSHTLNNIKEKSSLENQLIRTIDSRQFIKESDAFMFYGSEESLKQLTPILTKYDSASHENKSSYFLYKLEHSSGEAIEENLHDFVTKLKKSPDVEKSHANLIKLIENIRWIKETNSLMLTGNPEAINEAKELIKNYDVASHEKKQTDQFFIYKPKYLSAEKLETYLKQTLSDLKEAGLTDSALIRSITDMKVNKQTNSTVFTGSDPTIVKIKELLGDIDSPTLASLEEKNATFFIYKLQTASGPEVVNSIEGVAKDLSSLSSQSEEDKQFLETLSSVKYIQKTNSLLFTGSPAALERAKKLLINFDVPQLAGKVPSASTANSFFVYKPVYLPGPEIKTILANFGENLKSSGITDPDLFKTLETVQWTEKTNSLVLTGTSTALDRTKELLKTFDVPSGGLYPEALAPIQDIDDTSFLVYKLQFHKGEEIQIALRAVARDLINSGSKANTELLNSISSIRLIPMTNSLLCSGSPDILKRLKELIRNLDIPLQQVFIEMLVIETSATNSVSFGLGWASKMDYRGRTVGAVSNNSSSTSTFFNNFNAKDATTPPTGADMVIGDGFDLGIIGDIIKHKGETFLTIGSLVKAVEKDIDSSIVMTPKLITQDSKTSEIFIGQNIPFVGSFVSNAGANTIETQNLEYRDIGINLVLTPILGNSDIVTLKLAMSRTSADTQNGQTAQTSIGGVTGITTSKTTMNTTVHIPNKNFLVLTGMVNSTKVHQKQGIPCLGGLPLIGAAFTDSNETDTNNNIVIFIRPHIISSYQDMIQLTESQEDFFRDQAGSFELEKDFEEAMEMIKSEEDE